MKGAATVDTPRLKALSLDNPEDRRDEIIHFLATVMEGRPPLPAAVDSWSWYYFSGPAGRGIISLVIDPAAGDRIAGYSAVCLLPCRIGGKEAPAGRIGPVYISPDYRGRGAYPMLRQTEDESARARRLPLLFCTPNRALAPSLHRSAFRLHQRLAISHAPLRFLNRQALRRPMSVMKQAGFYALRRATQRRVKSRGLDIHRLETFGNETEQIWNGIRENHVGIRKDPEYLNWRYGTRPNASFLALLGSKQGRPRALCIVEWRNDQP